VDFEHSAWEHLEQPLTVELNVAELLEDNVHGIDVGEALHGDQSALLAGLVAVDPNNLTVAEVLLLLVHAILIFEFNQCSQT